MTNFKFYDGYLELHDHHTLWDIDKEFYYEDYENAVHLACIEMEHHYKDLTVYLLGRSGRHVCVEDTPTNRRRYQQLIEYAKKSEKEIIDYFNNEYKMEV